MTRQTKSRSPLLLRAVLLLLSATTLLTACGPKVPPPPPEFDTATRAPTGDNRIEERIIKLIRLEQIGEKELINLQKEVLSGRASEAKVADYVVILVLRGELSSAINLLHRRGISALGDDGMIADALGLAMGQRRWRACEQIASDFLRRRLSAGGFLIRGLCRSRSESPSAANEDYKKADQLLPLGDGVLEQLRTFTTQRASSGVMRPASEKAYGKLMAAMMQRGVLDRLFVQHLLGRFESSLQIGSLEIGTLSIAEIRQVVLSRARSYRQCYAMAKAHRPYRPVLSGGVTLEFLINSAGSVREITVSEDNWGGHHAGPFLNTCLSEQLESLRFPLPRNAMSQRTQHHFSFSN